MRSSAVMPWSCASGWSITRWRKTGFAIGFTSSGVTKSRPSLAAMTCAARSIAIEARGDAPSSSARSARVRSHEVDDVADDRVVDAHGLRAASASSSRIVGRHDRAASCERSAGSKPLGVMTHDGALHVARADRRR